MVIIESHIHWKTSTFLQKQEKIRRKGIQVWRSKDRNFLYTWDGLHGEIEVYNVRGYAIFILNPDGTRKNKNVVRGRTIDD
jgi:hypothetical protein